MTRTGAQPSIRRFARTVFCVRNPRYEKFLVVGRVLFVVWSPCPVLALTSARSRSLTASRSFCAATTWFSLAEGVRIRDGDVVDLPDKSQLQVEMNDGGARRRHRPRRPVRSVGDAARCQAAGDCRVCSSPAAGSSSTPSRRATAVARAYGARCHYRVGRRRSGARRSATHSRCSSKPESPGCRTRRKRTARGARSRRADSRRASPGKPFSFDARARSAVRRSAAARFHGSASRARDEIRFRARRARRRPRSDLRRGAALADRAVSRSLHQALRAASSPTRRSAPRRRPTARPSRVDAVSPSRQGRAAATPQLRRKRKKKKKKTKRKPMSRRNLALSRGSVDNREAHLEIQRRAGRDLYRWLRCLPRSCRTECCTPTRAKKSCRTPAS